MPVRPSYVELRIHGVSGTTPEDMLGTTQVEDVAGDELVRFVRATEQSHRELPGDGVLEAVSWGRLTSGLAAQAAWVVMLPFALVNLAMWTSRSFAETGSRPRAARARAAASRGCVRLLGLTVTVVATLTAALLAMDLVGWQCGRVACAVVSDRLAFAEGWSRGARVAVASAVPVLVLAAIAWLSHRVSLRYEAASASDVTAPPATGAASGAGTGPAGAGSTGAASGAGAGPAGAGSTGVASGAGTASPGSGPGAGTTGARTGASSGLRAGAGAGAGARPHPATPLVEQQPTLFSPLMWHAEPMVQRLRCVHLSVGWASVGVLLVWAVRDQVGAAVLRGGADSVLWWAATACLVLVVVAGGLLVALPTRWVAWTERPLRRQGVVATALQVLALAGVGLAAASFARTVDGLAEDVTGPIPGLGGVLAVVVWVQVAVLLVLGGVQLSWSRIDHAVDRAAVLLLDRLVPQRVRRLLTTRAVLRHPVRSARALRALRRDRARTRTAARPDPAAAWPDADAAAWPADADAARPDGPAAQPDRPRRTLATALRDGVAQRRSRARRRAERRAAPVAPRPESQLPAFLGLAPWVVAASGVLLAYVYTAGVTLRFGELLTPTDPDEGALAVPALLTWASGGFAVVVALALLTGAVAFLLVSRAPARDVVGVVETFVHHHPLPAAERPAAFRAWRDDFRIRRIVRARRLQRLVQARWILDGLGCASIVGVLIAVAALTSSIEPLASLMRGRPAPGAVPEVTVAPDAAATGTPWPVTVGHGLGAAGSWALTALAVGVVGLVVTGWRSPAVRRRVGVAWDVLSFWPRGGHPFAPPSYTERAVPQIVARTRFLAREPASRPRVLLSGHSQGSVLAAAVVAQLRTLDAAEGFPVGDGALARVALLTHGSPLGRLYQPLFPQYFSGAELVPVAARSDGDPAGRSARHEVGGPEQLRVLDDALGGRWLNLWRDTDPIGSSLASALHGHDIECRDPLDYLLDEEHAAYPPVHGHGDYPGAREYGRAREHLVGVRASGADLDACTRCAPRGGRRATGTSDPVAEPFPVPAP